MTERVFTLEDQLSFAKVSGDYNPLHIDSIQARRLIYGKPVVHGIHAVLWALDTWLKNKKESIELVTLDVDFIRPLAVNAVLQSIILKESASTLTMYILERGVRALKFKATFLPSSVQEKLFFKPISDIGECYNLTKDELLDASGQVDLNNDIHLADELFPDVNRNLPSSQVADLLAITKVVGMKCPGSNSLFSGLSLKFTGKASEAIQMNYYVKEFDTRFSRVVLNVVGASASGELYVFYRPPQKQQPSYLDIKQLVSKNEFSGQRALIIGGSRGLGEVTAKLLAAGGADVVITYYRGSHDANKILAEINSEGGSISSIEYDVMTPPGDLLLRLKKNWQPTHLYYFATPFIFDGNRGKFDSNLYDKFCNYYVKGFVNTIHAFRDIGCKFEKVFYPSSIAVEELPEDMMEYSAAKAAGESICKSLDSEENKTDFIIHRLQRLDTDQTASLLQVENNDPVPCMLKIIQQLQSK